MKPIISVFLPTYNRAYILRSAVESILNQTFKDFEILIVDDASTDNTRELIESIKDERIRYIRHEKNKGLTAGHNTAIAHAKGMYMATLGSDDIWFPETLQRMVDGFKNTDPRVGIVYTRLKKHFLNGRTEFIPSLDEKPEGNLYTKLLGGNFITMQVALLKMECFKNEPFDENIIALQDWEIWLRIAKKWGFKLMDYVGCEASIMPDSITSKKKLRLDSRRKIFDKHEEDFRRYPAIYAHHAFTIGHAYGLAKEPEIGKKYMKKAWRTRFWNPKYAFSFFILKTSLVGKNPTLYKKIAKIITRQS